MVSLLVRALKYIENTNEILKGMLPMSLGKQILSCLT